MIIYNTKVPSTYLKPRTCHRVASQRREIKRLTRRNRQFLQSLGLKVR